MLSALAAFWMIGNITVAALAWAIIPNKLGTDNPEGKVIVNKSCIVILDKCRESSHFKIHEPYRFMIDLGQN